MTRLYAVCVVAWLALLAYGRKVGCVPHRHWEAHLEEYAVILRGADAIQTEVWCACRQHRTYCAVSR